MTMTSSAEHRGRPREIADPVRVTVTIEGADYERFEAEARQAGHGSVARVIRERATRRGITAAQNPGSR